MKYIKKIAGAIFIAFFMPINTGILFTSASTIIKNDTNNVSQQENTNQNYVAGEVLVKYKNNKINLETTSGLNKSSNFALSNSLIPEGNLADDNISVLKITDDKTVEEKIAELQNNPNVEFVQPNFLYYPVDDPYNIGTNDPYDIYLWNLYNSKVPQAWKINEGTNAPVIVAVIDNGVDYTHPDLVENMWDGTNCKDERGNNLGGCSYGYDYYDNDKMPFLVNDNAFYMHGTHVAGMIAAVKNNGIGVVGVAPNAKIMALRVGGESFGTYNIAKAINFAKQNGAKIINASFGYDCAANYDFLCRDDAMRSAIKSFPGLFIAAAGNSARNNDGGNAHFYPSDFSEQNIISVAATTSSDNLAGYSNYGTTSVDVGAPGDFVYSTVASSSYGRMSGTSMAAPSVVGLAALIEGYNPNLTALQVKNIILSTGDTLPDLTGKTVTGKRIDDQNALVASALTTFDFTAPQATGVVDGNPQNSNVISVTVPYKTDLTNLTPTITTVTGATVSPASGIAQDFTNSVSYTISVTDSSNTVYSQNYTVIVTAQPDPDIALVSADKLALTIGLGLNPNLSDITTPLLLTTSGTNGSTITWSSSNTSVISNGGQTITRPAFGSGNATVTLTATITKGIVTDTKNFILTVLELPDPDIAFVAADKLALTIGLGLNPDLSDITTPLVLTTSGTNGSTITWSSSNSSVISNDGQTVNRPTFDSGNATVTLTATVAKGVITDTKVFSLTILKLPNPDIVLVAADKLALTIGLGSNPDLLDITTPLLLTTSGTNGSTISWVSSHLAIVVNGGQTTITRPVFSAGNATVTLNAIITKGVVTDIKTFSLIVLKLPEVPIIPNSVVQSGGGGGGGAYNPPTTQIPTPTLPMSVTPQARAQIISYVSDSLNGLSSALMQQSLTPTPERMQIIQSLLQVLMQLLKLVL